jgi:hypothetical protein
MKHATEQALSTMSGLLEELRALPGLRERKPGVFYYKSRAFLHFHEDGDRIYADVRLEGSEFDRLAASRKSLA